MAFTENEKNETKNLGNGKQFKNFRIPPPVYLKIKFLQVLFEQTKRKPDNLCECRVVFAPNLGAGIIDVD
jgi:hypothetical protein